MYRIVYIEQNNQHLTTEKLVQNAAYPLFTQKICLCLWKSAPASRPNLVTRR